MKLTSAQQSLPEHFPVEVREEDFTLHTKGPLKGAIEGLSAGTYVVTVTLPDDASLTAKVEVPEEIAESTLSPAEAFLGRVHEQTGRQSYPGSLPQGADPVPDPGARAPGRDEATSVAKLFRGDPLLGAIVSQPLTQEALQPSIGAVWRLMPNADVRILQLACQDGWHLNIVIPPFTELRVDLCLRLDREVYAISFPEPSVNTLVGLQVNGQLEQVAARVKDIASSSIGEMLRTNYGSGIAYCYALLRSPEAARLNAILTSVHDMQCRADMCVLRGELLARHGDDEQAMRMFIAAAEAGLPCFTEGVNTLLDRLSFYQMSEAGEIDGPLLDPATRARQAELMARLRRFAPACDQSAVLTSFWGADPNAPDLEEATTEQR